MTDTQSTINKSTIQRLLKDVKQIIKHPLTDNGIYYSHDESDMLKGYAMIVGPEDTPYFGGFYFFKFDFPFDYPFSPPLVTYMTNDGKTRFNPNLYVCGKVCLSILNTWNGEKWSSCQTINSVLLALCTLLNESPLENEPGHNKKSPDFIPYQKSIEFSNINFAVCELMNRSTNKIPHPFQLFYPFMKENFLKNYSKLLAFSEKNMDKNGPAFVRIYSMSTKIDYNYLKNKLIDIKTFVELEK